MYLVLWKPTGESDIVPTLPNSLLVQWCADIPGCYCQNREERGVCGNPEKRRLWEFPLWSGGQGGLPWVCCSTMVRRQWVLAFGLVFEFFFFFLVLPLYCYQLISLHPLAHMLSRVTPWTTTLQSPLSMDFSRQEYWSGLPFPSSFWIFYWHEFFRLSYPGFWAWAEGLWVNRVVEDSFEQRVAC